MKILLFARYRELHGTDRIDLDLGDNPVSVAELRRSLRQSVGPELAEALGDENVVCAVNQQVVDDDVEVKPQDEVAFFPPMTGG